MSIMILPDAEYERLCELLRGADVISDASCSDGAAIVEIRWNGGGADPDAAKELRELLMMLCGIKNAIQKCRALDLYGIDWRELLPRRFRELYREIEEERMEGVEE